MVNLIGKRSSSLSTVCMIDELSLHLSAYARSRPNKGQGQRVGRARPDVRHAFGGHVAFGGFGLPHWHHPCCFEANPSIVEAVPGWRCVFDCATAALAALAN